CAGEEPTAGRLAEEAGRHDAEEERRTRDPVGRRPSIWAEEPNDSGGDRIDKYHGPPGVASLVGPFTDLIDARPTDHCRTDHFLTACRVTCKDASYSVGGVPNRGSTSRPARPGACPRLGGRRQLIRCQERSARLPSDRLVRARFALPYLDLFP